MPQRTDPRRERYREASVNIVGKYATDGEPSLGATSGLFIIDNARINATFIPNAGGMWSVNIFRGAEWGAGAIKARIIFATSGTSTDAIPIKLTMRQLSYGSATVTQPWNLSLSLTPSGVKGVPMELDVWAVNAFAAEYDLLASHVYRAAGGSNLDTLYIIGVIYEYVESG